MVTQFVNNMMLDGKTIAFKIFYKALEVVESRVDDESPLEFEEGRS